MRRRGLPAALTLAIVVSLVVSAGSAATAQERFRVVQGGVSQANLLDAPKSVSGKLAETDESLLGRASSAPLNVVVKLDYDAIASYAGGIAGLRATSPSVTGRPLARNAAAVAAYRSYVTRIERQVLRTIDARIPAATPGSSFRFAYG